MKSERMIAVARAANWAGLPVIIPSLERRHRLSLELLRLCSRESIAHKATAVASQQLCPVLREIYLAYESKQVNRDRRRLAVTRINRDSDEARYVAATTASGLQRPESIMSRGSRVTWGSTPHLTDFMVRALLRDPEKSLELAHVCRDCGHLRAGQIVRDPSHRGRGVDICGNAPGFAGKARQAAHQVGI